MLRESSSVWGGNRSRKLPWYHHDDRKCSVVRKRNDVVSGR